MTTTPAADISNRTPQTTEARAYTLGELTVASAAREIRGGEIVFVGMRLPLIAFVVAKKTHAPTAIGIFEHSKERLPERVLYITSPGNGEGGHGWRKRVGLPQGGPSAVITTKAVLRFAEDGEAYLSSLHPGIELDDVLANTGWKLRVGKDLIQTPEPS